MPEAGHAMKMNPARRGRRRSSTIQRERIKHVLAAKLLYIKGIAEAVCCRILECSRSTLYAWARKALDYPEYLAECRHAYGA